MMKVLYHMTNLPPKMAGTEASLQELEALRRHFGGNLIYLNPNQHSPVYLPRLLFGFHKLKQIRREEAGVQLHHLYNADPFPFPIVRWFRRPVIYSISSGIGRRGPNMAFFNALAAVAVSDERSLKRLQERGSGNSHLVRPGIDTAHFSHVPTPLRSDIRVMVGSAPWTKAQFSSKGVDALLEAARQNPHVHLVFLWRGVLTAEMERRVGQTGLKNQVTILDSLVDVNDVLATVHASITLANSPVIVKAYPHSLLESLAASKPVLVSRAIPMADYVEATGCGKVVEDISAEAILESLEGVAREYTRLQKSAQAVGQRDFSLRAMISSYEKVYAHIS
jgi:glycosyltransferase involved in cell wall biosynthesis